MAGLWPSRTGFQHPRNRGYSLNLHKLVQGSRTKEQQIDSGEESHDALEEVFSKIQAVTGEENLDLLVTRFIHGKSVCDVCCPFFLTLGWIDNLCNMLNMFQKLYYSTQKLSIKLTCCQGESLDMLLYFCFNL